MENRKNMENWIGRLEEEEYEKNTLTIEQLMSILQKYPKDMKVMITCESTINSIQTENIYESITGKLYIDADENYYKQYFAKNPKENEYE